MANVTFVIGLCGSGKSYLIAQMSGVYKIEESFLGRIGEFFTVIEQGKDCVVSELALLRKENRDQIVREILARAPDTKVEWICFENDLKKANRNCLWERGVKQPGSEQDHININRFHSPHYTYPDGAKILPIWNGEEVKEKSDVPESN